ncbi:hypothetical protein [Spiroplasma phoeniceum]|uniref:Uncharacterized protein n=1 Tax=Spiroplasma phoeniceum P40 TaxID=1276259 RepID=A0A345DS08_9MOLU|nr:hypothetical protein [Spiroplasma phoeniceum]AXF96999.1 hypothetical protein SDAV_002066 [Spiroplasma phoeniceum P40]
MLKLIRLLTAALQDTKIGELLKDGLKKYGIIKKKLLNLKNYIIEQTQGTFYNI